MPREPRGVPDLDALPPGGSQHGALDMAAAAFSLVWLLGVGLYLWLGLNPSGVLGLVMTLLIVVLPLGLTWFAVGTLKAIRGLRAESDRLQSTVDSMRVSYASSQQQAQAASGRGAAQAQALALPPQRPTETVSDAEPPPMTFASRRDQTATVPSADRKTPMRPPRPPAATEEQPGLALGTPLDDGSQPLGVEDFLRAIHFPEGPEDKAGFQALRLALADRTTAKLIRAAQDVLTLLAQDGIYMDDLSPDRARPELWRKFAAGERGRGIAGLGGVRDRSCLALTAARMREDAVFRDAAHHFLRSFDKAIAAIEPRASDAELSFLSDTRSARAFMLFGRVTGTFD